MLRQSAKYKDQLRVDKRRHFVRKVFFIILIIAVFVIAMIYLLFFAGIFDIRTVLVKSDVQDSELETMIETSTNQWLNDKKFFLQRRNNIIAVETDELQDKLIGWFPKIDSIIISKHFGHKLAINVKERSPLGIWCMNLSQRCFYFNKAGVVYDDSPQTFGFLILAVNDGRDRIVNLGDKAVDDIWLGAIIDSYDKLLKNKIQIKSFVIPADSTDEFHVLTSANFKILLNINTDIDAQIDAMVSFMKQKLSDERISQLQYIDLRIQDRIYYK